jgi:hypothetical protein
VLREFVFAKSTPSKQKQKEAAKLLWRMALGTRRLAKLKLNTKPQKQASIAAVLADFVGEKLNQIMACIQQLPRLLTRAAIRQEIEAECRKKERQIDFCSFDI